MRKTIATVVVFVALCVGYVAWPFASMFAVVRAAQAGDVAKVQSRVNFPALRRSLAGQIVATYARLNGMRPDPTGLTVGAVTSFMDPFIEKLTSPVAITELMRSGWPKGVLDEHPAGIEGLDLDSLGNVWQLYLNSDYGFGEVRTTVPIRKPRVQQYRVQLALSDWTWKLSGLDLPVALQERLVRELMKQQGKAE
jgi:Protein of unknown function (DUF2939)